MTGDKKAVRSHQILANHAHFQGALLVAKLGFWALEIGQKQRKNDRREGVLSVAGH